jgi:multidrug resistance protein, MATE family
MSENALAGPRSLPRASASEWRAMAAIATPVVVVQVGLMLMGVVDTLMVGRVDANALAAVALGNLYFFNAIVIPMGALMVLDPLVSQAVGANDEIAITRAVQRGLLLALVFGIVATVMMLPVAPLLRLFRQPTEVIPEARTYVHIGAWSMIPFLAFVVLRQSLQALHRLAPIVITIVVANLLNAALNYVLIFGYVGFPRLEVAGAAIATVIGRWFMFIALAVIGWRALRPHLAVLDRQTLSWPPLQRMLALGLPIGFQQFLEYSAFAAVGLMMGTFGAVQVASHQIALNLAALTFMVPLGVASAAAVRVGNAIGAADASRSRRAARIAYVLGGGFMTTTAALFLLFPRQLAGLYTPEHAVIGIAAALIPIAGIFQVFDGLQAVGAGVLRGLGDTRVPLVAMLAGYWLIGVPISVFLGYKTSLGPEGLWWGFVAGLASVAVFLLIRVRALFRRDLQRVHVETTAVLH